MALRKAPLSEADRWLNHFSSCSPCFQEFTQFRKQALVRRSTQIWLAAAAVFIFAVAGWFWVRTRPPTQTATVVLLDLRGRATVRGENPSETTSPLLVLPRNAKTLHLELPIGSNEGAYDLAILDQSGAEVFRTSATAQLEDHIVVLTSDVDLAGVSPGSYFLGLRQRDLEWTRFPIRVH
jgi:multidrug efflux pump subunit AcrA (membrane-fusion protein)